MADIHKRTNKHAPAGRHSAPASPQAQSKKTARKAVVVVCAVFGLLFAAVIAAGAAFTMTNNQQESDMENRELTTFSQALDFSTEMTLDERVELISDAFSDQMSFREFFSKVYYLINPVAIQNSDIVVSESPKVVPETPEEINDPDPGMQLFPKEADFRTQEEIEEDAQGCAEVINTLAQDVTDAGSTFIWMSVPRKDAVMVDYLPKGYVSSAEEYVTEEALVEEQLSENVNVLDCYKVFEEVKDVYSRPYLGADHHFNVRGGWYVYSALMDILHENGCDIETLVLEDRFTLYARVVQGSYLESVAGSINLNPEYSCMTYKGDLDYTWTIDGEETDRDVYGTGTQFKTSTMWGIHAESIVTIHGNEDKPSIMFIGTSYNVILEGFCVPSFSQVISVDYRDRYFADKETESIQYYLDTYHPDYVVFTAAGQLDAFGVENYVEESGPSAQYD